MAWETVCNDLGAIEKTVRGWPAAAQMSGRVRRSGSKTVINLAVWATGGMPPMGNLVRDSTVAAEALMSGSWK